MKENEYFTSNPNKINKLPNSKLVKQSKLKEKHDLDRKIIMDIFLED